MRGRKPEAVSSRGDSLLLAGFKINLKPAVFRVSFPEVMRFRSFSSLIFVLSVIAFLSYCRKREKSKEPVVTSFSPETTVRSFVVQPAEIMPFLFNRAGVERRVADRLIARLREFGFNFRQMRPGDSLILFYRNETLFQVHYFRSYDSIYQIVLGSAEYQVALISRPITIIPALVQGEITSSLYQAMIDKGEKPCLVADYTEIFDWEIDFFSETQPGDSFIILVSRKYADSVLVGYTPIVAARYKGAVGDFFAFRFTDPDGKTDYYNQDGLSMRKTFLKSPLRFSRISSFFGNRFHPIRRIRCLHQGVDYAAPTGTPVSCVADGRVISAGWSGGYGRLVRVGHRDGFESRYGHLSRFGKGVKAGAPVIQGQTIGYVGSTGLSTGPHLHYEVRKYGSPVNPLRLNPPRAGAVKLAYLPLFRALRDSLITFLVSDSGPGQPLLRPLNP